MTRIQGPATTMHSSPRGGLASLRSRMGLPLALLLGAAGAVGCSSDKGAESQFHAVDGKKASVLFYIGYQLPSDDLRLAPEARGKVLACWYRSDVLLRNLEPALAQGSMTAAQAHAVFFASGNAHKRVTRYPSACEDVPRQAAKSLGVSAGTDYTPMCNPGFDKAQAVQGQSAESLELTSSGFNLGNLLGQVALNVGQSYLQQRAAERPNDTLAQVAASPAFTSLVSSQFGVPTASQSGETAQPMTVDRALPQLLTTAIGTEAQRNPNNRFLTLANGLTPLFSNSSSRTTGDTISTIGTAAATAFGDSNGTIGIGKTVRFTPANFGALLSTLFARQNPAAAASPTASPSAAVPPTTVSLDADFETAHPKVEMHQLELIARDVQRNVGRSGNVSFAGTDLKLDECPLDFK